MTERGGKRGKKSSKRQSDIDSRPSVLRDGRPMKKVGQKGACGNKVELPAKGLGK